jgi:hypothetical protein
LISTKLVSLYAFNDRYYVVFQMASDSSADNQPDEAKAIVVHIFSSRESAALAAANLEARGIACWITADDCGGMYPSLTAPGGVRLLVRQSDAEAAIALLDTQVSPAELNQIETGAVASSPPETTPLKKLALGQIVSGLAAGIIFGIWLCLLYQWANQLGTKTYYQYRDGKRDEAWLYRDGQLVEFLQDRNLDGHWDHWTYYENGRAVRSEYDNNFDGKADLTWTYSNGTVVSMEKDTDFNGTPDWFCTYKDDIIQETDMKPNGAKFTTVRELFQNGVLTEIDRGGDSDGDFKEIVRYDPFFNPIGTKPINTNISTEFNLLLPGSK